MYCLDTIYPFLNLNQIHSMTYTVYIFIFPLSLNICYSVGRCVLEVLYVLQKSQRSSALNWNSLRLLVSHYICLWAAVLCGQIWSIDFKLVYSTIWRNGFQPKHLINSESRWPCLCFATCKCWTQWQSEDKCTCIVDQVPAPSHLVMITPNPIFTIFPHFILLHSIWKQAIDTWKNIHVWEQITQFDWQYLPLLWLTWDNLQAEHREIWKT